MVPGIYSIQFKSSMGYSGEGWTLIDNGRVYGGDHRYIYRGQYLDHENSLKVEIEVLLYRDTEKPISVFGYYRQFNLSLFGHSEEDHFTVAGTMVKQPMLSITIEGRKIADLIS
jgi:hypothetical protein